jgi:hypothetical protein
VNLKKLRIDSNAIEQGRWIDRIPGLGDIRLKVRGLGNVDWRRLNMQLTQALPRTSRGDPVEQARITLELLVENRADRLGACRGRIRRDRLFEGSCARPARRSRHGAVR